MTTSQIVLSISITFVLVTDGDYPVTDVRDHVTDGHSDFIRFLI